MLGNFLCFCCHLTFFEIYPFKKHFRNSIRPSNSLDPNQDRGSVGPDLGPNCFQITSFLFQAEWTAESHLSRDTIQKVLSTISYDTPPINLQGHLSVGLIPTVIREVPDALVSQSTIDKTICLGPDFLGAQASLYLNFRGTLTNSGGHTKSFKILPVKLK